MSARAFIKTTPLLKSGSVKINEWIIAKASARIDLAGGWSDTPPIAYEHGGAVTNIAILVDGKRPIGCKVRKVRITNHSKSPCFIFVVHGASTETIIVDNMHQLQTYHQPQSPAALLKAVVCCAGLVDEHSPIPLSEQLSTRLDGCGFEMHSWSDLPAGSGLGTSSILAGCALAAVWSNMGLKYDNESVYHAVLHLEQMLTTGGGWQDQVGGIAPGMKFCTSARGLPLHVTSVSVKVSNNFLEALSAHIVLIYTGKTRLARNLLQNVLRNWYSLDPDVMDNVRNLVTNAGLCATAAREENLEGLGKCIDKYWHEKKLMAPGCEPPIVTKIMMVLRPMSYGLCMCGAGGGGFMYALTREPNMDSQVLTKLRQHPELSSVRVHKCAIDIEGMRVTRETVKK